MPDDLYVWVDPGRMYGAPCLAGTRIPTYTAAEYVSGGLIDELRDGWDFISDRQWLIACWYEAAHGTMTDQWGRYADELQRLTRRSDATLDDLPDGLTARVPRGDTAAGFPTEHGEEHPEVVADDLEALADQTSGVLDFEVRRLLNHAVEIIRWADES